VGSLNVGQLAIWSVALAAIGYFLGGVPFSLIVAKKVAGVDLRKVGSGNLGATNVARNVGGRWAVVVFFLDALKGAVPVAIAMWLAPRHLLDWYLVLGAVSAILGHVYSPYIKFRGGKGVAVTAGAAAVMNPACLIFGAIVFFSVALTSRWVSLGSLVMGLSYPPLVLWLYPGRPLNLIFSCVVTAIIWWSHRANIKRLLAGEEPKASWGIFRDKGAQRP
jgi:glycerol-3-phosphate acyltransferase PlsY